MRKNEVLAVINDSGLPARVKDYFARAAGGKRASALKAGLKKDPAGVIKSVDGLLAAAGGILGRPKDDVLFITGFNSNDLAPERFDAALAELRAVLFLHGEGFRELAFLPQAKGISADISGVHDARPYVFEVCCLRAEDGLVSAAEVLGVKYEKKKRQMNNARKKLPGARGGLFFAAGPLAASAAADKAALDRLARTLYEEKKEPPFTHLCMLSGGLGAVYPPWE